MRPAHALIDLSALRHNYQLAKSLSERRALAVVKANAYGHGAVQCAEALQTDADGFAVACIEEALELRAAGIRGPILLLEGGFDTAIPATARATMDDRLGHPERWWYPTGHYGLFLLLPGEGDAIVAWIRRTLGIEPTS